MRPRNSAKVLEIRGEIPLASDFLSKRRSMPSGGLFAPDEQIRAGTATYTASRVKRSGQTTALARPQSALLAPPATVKILKIH